MSDAKQELASDERARRREIRSDAELFEGLVAHPGWKRYLALIETVGQNFHSNVMKPMENSFEAVKVEYAKGALIALSLAASLPSAKIREAAELRNTDEEE